MNEYDLNRHEIASDATESFRSMVDTIYAIGEPGKTTEVKKALRKRAGEWAKKVLSASEDQKTGVVLAFKELAEEDPIKAGVAYLTLKHTNMLGRVRLRKYLGVPPSGRFIK